MELRLTLQLPTESEVAFQSRYKFEQEVIQWFGTSSPQSPLEAALPESGVTIRRFESKNVSIASVCWRSVEDWPSKDWVGYELIGESIIGLMVFAPQSNKWNEFLEKILGILGEMIEGNYMWAICVFCSEESGYESIFVDSPQALSRNIRNYIIDQKNLIARPRTDYKRQK